MELDRMQLSSRGHYQGQYRHEQPPPPQQQQQQQQPANKTVRSWRTEVKGSDSQILFGSVSPPPPQAPHNSFVFTTTSAQQQQQQQQLWRGGDEAPQPLQQRRVNVTASHPQPRSTMLRPGLDDMSMNLDILPSAAAKPAGSNGSWHQGQSVQLEDDDDSSDFHAEMETRMRLREQEEQMRQHQQHQAHLVSPAPRAPFAVENNFLTAHQQQQQYRPQESYITSGVDRAISKSPVPVQPMNAAGSSHHSSRVVSPAIDVGFEFATKNSIPNSLLHSKQPQQQPQPRSGFPSGARSAAVSAASSCASLLGADAAARERRDKFRARLQEHKDRMMHGSAAASVASTTNENTGTSSSNSNGGPGMWKKVDAFPQELPVVGAVAPGSDGEDDNEEQEWDEPQGRCTSTIVDFTPLPAAKELREHERRQAEQEAEVAMQLDTQQVQQQRQQRNEDTKHQPHQQRLPSQRASFTDRPPAALMVSDDEQSFAVPLPGVDDDDDNDNSGAHRSSGLTDVCITEEDDSESLRRSQQLVDWVRQRSSGGAGFFEAVEVRLSDDRGLAFAQQKQPQQQQQQQQQPAPQEPHKKPGLMARLEERRRQQNMTSAAASSLAATTTTTSSSAALSDEDELSGQRGRAGSRRQRSDLDDDGIAPGTAAQQPQPPQVKPAAVASVAQIDYERMAADLKAWQQQERDKMRAAEEAFRREKEQQPQPHRRPLEVVAAVGAITPAVAVDAPRPLDPPVPQRLSVIGDRPLELSAHQRRVVAKCVDILLQACFECDPGRAGVLPLLRFHRILADVIAANSAVSQAAPQPAPGESTAPPPSHLLIAHFLHVHDKRKMLNDLDTERVSYLNFISWVLQL